MHLQLTIPCDWDSIEPAREAVRNAAAASLDPNDADTLGMVAGELLENAIKYGARGPIRFRLDVSDNESIFTVTNSVDPDQDLAPLLARVALVGRGADETDYEKMVAEVARRRQLGGLGLVRIAAHGNCTVEADTTRRGEVTIRARCSGS